MGEPPLLFTAAGCGDCLAARVRQLARSWPDGGPAATGSVSDKAALVSRGDVAVAWAALQLLPHSCERWQEVRPWPTGGRCLRRCTLAIIMLCCIDSSVRTLPAVGCGATR